MNKKFYIEDLKEGTSIEDVFFIKTLNEKKDAEKRYYMLTLSDRTGIIAGNIWTESYREEYRNFNETFVRVKGTVILHAGVSKIKITNMVPVDPKEIHIDEFVFVAPNIQECYELIKKRIDEIASPSLKKLVQIFYNRKDVVSLMFLAPAGTEIHHNYVGGFMVHTTSVLEDSLSYVDNYTLRSPRSYKINKDLVTSGALLHDIGKLKEYKQAPTFKRTKAGKLMGHILLGLEMVSNAANVLQAKGIQFNELDELKHIIAASHGAKGPVLPQTIEAQIVANSDSKDSAVCSIESQLHKEGFKCDSQEDIFTNYNKFHGTNFYYKGYSEGCV